MLCSPRLRLVAAGVCSQPAKVSDRHGRTLLHAAASSGRKRVVEWLVGVKEAALNPKDAESGYTALHRAIYSGQESTRKSDVILIFLRRSFRAYLLSACHQPTTFASDNPPSTDPCGRVPSGQGGQLGSGRPRGAHSLRSCSHG